MASLLNDINESELDALIAEYGTPKEFHFKANFLDFECNLVKRTESKGRLHDITCFIQQDDGYVVIQKHQYARSGIYRAPSGGANTGESLREAATREMYEETGLIIELERFVLDLHLDVICNDRTIPWRTFVFLASSTGGEMKPIDTHEIFDIKVLTRDYILGPINQLMEDSGWGGFKYRAFLTREFFKCLDEFNI